MNVFVTGQLVNSNLQNNSSSKQMYSFPKAKRFFELSSSSSRNSNFYNIPASLSHRSTSFGFGNKYDITTLNNNKERLKIKVPYYNLSHVKVSSMPNSPKYSFGLSRDKFTKCLVDGQVFLPTFTSPGPAVYNTRGVVGNNTPKYSFREKIQYKGKGYRLNVPGPGNYSAINMSKVGKYPISKFRNIEQAAWSLNKEKRFKEKTKTTPGPGNYEVKGLINGRGSVYNSKFRSGTARSMGLRLRGIFDVSDKNATPGPGAYSSFSEFGFYQVTHTDSGRYPGNRTEYGNFGHRPKLISRVSSIKSNYTTKKQ